ncbi:multidrug effflux MFS transporter [Roseicella frigidaeris]|uniref:Bcr/CflA family efflux transporter n=1 Tax=Roseicella frigidaeris TaxID=2230885 RepID=A0A327MC93_9PROT|nr:multidrug effflux MFS transporter [Roseicella frigidaeris]RAI57808.1 Bcr/CflA family drug resistance efflux transporter [Roseicella frigidaeris]
MAQPRRREPPLWLLVLITLSGTMAMHMFVPALPEAAADLGASVAAMQATISLYILGLAAGQLVCGPLSDRLGRRPTLLWGLGLFTLGGLVAALAPGVRLLIAARLFQALGGCAGLVLGRAMARDTATADDVVRRMALLTLMMMTGPALAPLIGGLLASTLGWRAILVLLTGFGLANLLLSWRLLPETGQRGSGPGARALWRAWRGLLTSPAFLGYAIGGGCATTSMYAFVAAAPFVFVAELHRPVEEVGLYLGMLILGMACGNLLIGRLLGRVRAEGLMVGANLLSLASAATLLGAVLLGRLSVPVVMGLMLVFTFGVGMASPTALTKAVGVDPKVIGSASGLYGFSQMAVGALCSALAGIGPDPALAAALVMTLASLCAQLGFWVALRREGRGA